MNSTRFFLAWVIVSVGVAEAAPGPDLTGMVKAKDGKAVAGAGVFIHTAGPRVGISPFCPSCYADCRKSDRSDAQGRFAIPLLDDALLFRVLVVAKGFQPTFVSKVDPAMGPIEAMLTPLNAAALTPKHQLRGRVLGPDKQPLANAVVNFQMYYSGDGGRGGNVPGFDPLAVTDEAGDFLLTGDKPFDAMDVTVEALGFAKKHFHRLSSGTKPHELAVTLGGSVSGRVLLAGQPLGGVAMGMVSVDRSDEFTGDYEFATHKDGRFLFVNLPPNQDYFIYGLVDSLKPFGAIPSKKIRVNGDGSTAEIGDFTVRPGVRLAGQVVLADSGKIPPHTKLSVSLQDAWDSQVAEVGADGRFDFSQLPPGPVSVNIRVSGYRFAAKNASLDPLNPFHVVGRVSQDKTNLIVLLEPGPDLKFSRSSYSLAEEDRLENRPLRGAETVADPGTQHIVTGRVLDAETKSPIATFKLTPGREMVYPGARSATRPPPARPPSWESHRAAEGTGGKFTIALDKRTSRPVLMVQAQGYLPAASPPLDPSQTSYDFELTRGTGPQGRVVFPDGKPAALVSVLMLEETEQGHLRAEGRLESYGMRNPLATTDADGRFAFPPRLGSTLVAVAHERGFAQATAKELAAKPELILQPWSRITGKLLAQGKPVADERMTVTFVRDGIPYQPLLHLGLTSTTATDGAFAFDRVPAGELQLVILVPVGSGPGAGRSWSHSPQRVVVTKPGETLMLEVEKNSGGSQRFFPSAAKKP